VEGRSSKRARFHEILTAAAPRRVGLDLWNRMRAELDPISDSYLRNLFRRSGLPLDPLVEGVRQADLDELERSLLALAAVYDGARQAADRATQTRCRQLVIEAKAHARMALSRGRREKAEMVEWMLVWLENPGVFSTWVRLRKLAIAARSTPRG